MSAGMFPASMASARMLMIPVMMLAVVIAGGVRVKVKGSLKKCFYCLISRTGDTGVELNACFGKGCARATTDAAADQGVNTVFRQKSCQSTVAASVGIHDRGVCDLLIFDGIDLKLFCVSKMLEHFSVFISYCNFHIFYLLIKIFPILSVPMTAAATAVFSCAVAETVVSAFNLQRLAVHQGQRDLLPGRSVDLLDSGPRHPHVSAAFLLRSAFLVDQPDRFIFVNSQNHRIVGEAV